MFIFFPLFCSKKKDKPHKKSMQRITKEKRILRCFAIKNKKKGKKIYFKQHRSREERPFKINENGIDETKLIRKTCLFSSDFSSSEPEKKRK